MALLLFFTRDPFPTEGLKIIPLFLLSGIEAFPFNARRIERLVRSLLNRTADLEDPAIPAFPFYLQHVSAFRRGTFPAGFVPVTKSRANRIYILRTAQDLPARIFPVPEITHRTFPPLSHSSDWDRG
jgi:hypothetical protein